ncbi:hypothetical protein [Riemerella columbina]|uniref:hypothetical protein n=1 Tax=Riemerella columbina TaxID=103810 RepID=UPI0003716C01|nr:hypothetical protein [Riemerella columbina]
MSLFLNKLFRHLFFRFSQLFRIVNLSPNIGIAYIFEILLFVFIKIENNNYYPYIFLIPIFIFHFNRKDIKFLKHVFKGKSKLILICENIIFFMFLCITNLNYKFNYSFTIPLMIIILISTITSKKRISSINLTFLSNRHFEINSSFRRNPIGFITIIILLVISGYHPFTLFFYGIFFLDYFSKIYKYNESKEQLIMTFKNSKLKTKLYDNLKFFNLILIFTSLLYFLMDNPIQFYLAYLLIVNIFFSLIIIRKYVQYFHLQKENEYNTGIYMEYLIISILIIPGVLRIYKNFTKANKNIEKYVDY